jgi:hypothetical protein
MEPLPEDQLQIIEERYEWGRRLKMIKHKDYLEEIFDVDKIYKEMKKILFSVEEELKPDSQILFLIGIEWNKRKLKEKQWRKYDHNISVFREAWREFSPISTIRREGRSRIGYNYYLPVKVVSLGSRVLIEQTIDKFINLVSCFFEPESFPFADYLELEISIDPIIEKHYMLPGRKIWDSRHVSKYLSARKRPSRCEYKLDYKEAITIGDMHLVRDYYLQVYDPVFKDIVNRGLTIN